MVMDEENKLKFEKEKYVMKVFYLGLKIALIFAVPAIIGVFLGRKLDNLYNTGEAITMSILAFTFILSWVITIVMYKNLNRKIKDINQKILEIKEK